MYTTIVKNKIKGFVFNPLKWSWSLSDRDLSVNYVTASVNNSEN